MHTVLMTAAGLALLGVFLLTAYLAGFEKRTATGAFILVWLVIAVVNLWVGVSHGYTVVQELPYLAPVFGIPAAAALILARRGGTG